MSQPTVLWFRHDLRLRDNRALVAAVADAGPIIPVYVLDDDTPDNWRLGAASRWWLQHSLASLARDLEALGSRLILKRGNSCDVIAALAQEVDASAVHASRAYQPWAGRAEAELKTRLETSGIAFRRFAGTLLFEPEAVTTKAGGPFKVYSPFWRASGAIADVGKPAPRPRSMPAPARWPKSDRLAEWQLLPKHPDWAGGLRDTWTPGEASAEARLQEFLADGLADYTEQRNRPDRPATSRLSPHLAFGEISPATMWHAAQGFGHAHASARKGLETFSKEIVWREFSYHLLAHWPTLPEKNFRAEFDTFPWLDAPAHLSAWQRGQTGYPIVDAGMRELWHTGYMHNRVRMITASFLIKDLMIPWQTGAAWFWDTLVDADLASNSASWQWVAGSGADAAPYFRVFNPSLQGAKFDPAGAYVRRWVPELAELPDDILHTPWEAPEMVLRAAGVTLGDTYPRPIVDHAEARTRALAAFKGLRG